MPEAKSHTLATTKFHQINDNDRAVAAAGMQRIVYSWSFIFMQVDSQGKIIQC